MKRLLLVLCLVLPFVVTGCSENYANGERIGMVTQFSEAGLVWKSWEGHLNVTQTGMNSSVPFDFSIDNDKPDTNVINTIKAAADSGWKVKLTYHEVTGYNVFSNRGNTNHFIIKAEVLDKSPVATAFNGGVQHLTPVSPSAGRVVDTVYVVIVGKATQGYSPGK